jgi:hypothetical protein
LFFSIIDCLNMIKNQEMVAKIQQSKADMRSFEEFLKKMANDDYNDNLDISLENPQKKAELFIETALSDQHLTVKFVLILKDLVTYVPKGTEFKDAVVEVCERVFRKQMTETNHGFSDDQIVLTSSFITTMAIHKLITLKKLKSFESILRKNHGKIAKNVLSSSQ